MLFNSLEFLVFFPAVVAVFFLIPHRFRWALLLAASYYFYMAWRPEYVLLLIASTLVDYVAGLGMEQATEHVKRKLYLAGSLLVNLGLLFTFKYFNFFSESVVTALNSFNIFYESPTFALLLPIGISFYTFQTLSYTIDVYRGKRKAERHLGIFALYVSFFPQLVAGPIERSTTLLPQFYKKMQFDATRAVSGLRLMLWGFFLKVVIADNSGVLVDTAYGNPEAFGGLALSIATFFFSMQIFADFAGYSYIAIGAARVMGYDLMQNFNRPYFARSIGEFWRRWHISLMSWFRDYIYIPLGGSRVSKLLWLRNILVVFLVSGLWHGANFTFIVWGVLNGGYILLAKFTAGMREHVGKQFRFYHGSRLQTGLHILVTFVLVNLAWVFFRAPSLGDALFIVSRIAGDVGVMFLQLTDIALLSGIVGSLGLSRMHFFGLIAAIMVVFVVHLFEERGIDVARFERLPQLVRWTSYYALILFIVFFGFVGTQAFIYFQF